MKKYIIISAVCIVVVAVGVLAYFGINTLVTNKITCSSSNSGDVKIEQKYVLSYDKDVVNNATITKKFEYTDQTQFNVFRDVVVPSTDSNMSELKNKNVKFSSSVKDKTYSYILEVNVKNASKDDISKLGLDKSLKTLKANLEGQGLTCN